MHDYGGVILDSAQQRPHRHAVPRRHAAQHPVRLGHWTTRRARIRRPTSSGTRRRRSPITAGRSRCGSRSRRCAIATVDPQTWGILLYRNYPRDRHYQFFSREAAARQQLLRLPLERPDRPRELPAGGHLVAAPYASATSNARAARRARVAARRAIRVKPHAGVDVKCTPNADNAIDVTIKPDFSQVESDTAQISANERFALFFPEKRPFFLEGVDLFQTPIQAVYTRTITAPDWGGRDDGQGATAFATPRSSPTTTAAAASILPGPNGSSIWRPRTSARPGSSRAPSATSACRSSACCSTDREALRIRRPTPTTAWSAPTSSGGRQAPTS